MTEFESKGDTVRRLLCWIGRHDWKREAYDWVIFLETTTRCRVCNRRESEFFDWKENKWETNFLTPRKNT